MDAASEYAKAHLNINETTERTKRILKRTGLRLLNLDKEHLIIHRIDFHGDEPCGTPAIHVLLVISSNRLSKRNGESLCS